MPFFKIGGFYNGMNHTSYTAFKVIHSLESRFTAFRFEKSLQFTTIFQFLREWRQTRVIFRQRTYLIHKAVTNFSALLGHNIRRINGERKRRSRKAGSFSAFFSFSSATFAFHLPVNCETLVTKAKCKKKVQSERASTGNKSHARVRLEERNAKNYARLITRNNSPSLPTRSQAYIIIF